MIIGDQWQANEWIGFGELATRLFQRLPSGIATGAIIVNGVRTGVGLDWKRGNRTTLQINIIINYCNKKFVSTGNSGLPGAELEAIK